MKATRRQWIGAAAMSAAASAQVPSQPAGSGTRYVRFRTGNTTAHGLLEGDTIRTVVGDLFGRHSLGASHKLPSVKLLCPVVAPKVMAVGLNYRSHLGSATPPTRPEIFFKPVTCLIDPGEPIAIPADSKNTHYEGELVIVIGKHGSKLSVAQAKDAIFGVTCGNDVSERDWQGGPAKDLQWWRAKGSDTFGPCGPVIARGLDYGNLRLRTRLNGKVVQEQSTSDLLFDCPTIVQFISTYVTLQPGDLIYTGTPGSTQKMKSGDVVEVDIEGIGVLRSPVTAAKA